MKPNDLGANQIQPAAQPVSTFITTTAIEPAAPARPSQVQLSDTQIATIGTGGRGNVEGGNGGIALAQALSRFNQNLTDTLSRGLGMYASDQYRKGQNEAYKASAMVQRQMDQSSIEYANENRALARKDPIAALAMDTVNPFRLAGRKNALSQLAATEIPNAMLLAYEANRGELARLDPADPKINEVKAKAVQQTLDRYGLTPDEPGFLDFVVPVLNRSWERVTAQQSSDRQDWLKSTIPTTLPLTLEAVARQALANGATPAQAAAIVTRMKDQELSRLGLPQDAAAAEEKVMKHLLDGAIIGKPGEDGGEPVPDAALLEVLGMVEMGDSRGDANGIRPTAAYVFREDIYYERERRESTAWTQQQRQREMGSREFASDAITELLGMPDGPEKQQKIQELITSDDPRYAGLDAGERARLIEQMAGTAENLTERGYDSSGFENWMLELEERYGNSWDPNAAAEEFQGLIDTLPPGKEREDAQRRFLDLKRRKDREKQDMPASDISKAVDARIKANIEREYPGILGADAAGLDIGQYLKTKDADAAESAARQRAAYTKHIYATINAERAQLGRPLSPLEAQQAIDKALNDYGKSDPEATRKQLFPGGAASGAPTSVPGGKNKAPAGAPAAGGARPTPTKPAGPTAPTFPIGRLGDVPEDRLRNWRKDPIVNQDSLVTITSQILSGADFPKQLKQAARKAGTSPGQFLLDQLNLYPGTIDLKPDQRRQILRQGQQQASAQRYGDGLAAQARSILGHSAGWMARILIPAGPASAEPITWNPRSPRPTGGGGSVDGGYVQGNIGPTSTGAHFDVKKKSGGQYFDRKALDNYVEVNGKPLSSGATVSGGTFAGHQSRGSHGWDYAFGEGRYVATLKNGAKWLDGKPTEHGEARRFQLPNGDIYQFLHGTFEPGKGGGRSRRGKASTPTRSRITTVTPKGEAGWDVVKTAAAVSGIKFPELAAAMWAVESDWGRKPSGRHNYFNQKGPGKAVGTTEYVGGKPIGVTDQFLNFKSFGEALDHLATRWFKDFKGYRGINNARNINEAIQMLAQQGYATDPNYGVKLRRIMRQMGVKV